MLFDVVCVGFVVGFVVVVGLAVVLVIGLVVVVVGFVVVVVGLVVVVVVVVVLVDSDGLCPPVNLG